MERGPPWLAQPQQGRSETTSSRVLESGLLGAAPGHTVTSIRVAL